jgi:hypothetical protein
MLPNSAIQKTLPKILFNKFFPHEAENWGPNLSIDQMRNVFADGVVQIIAEQDTPSSVHVLAAAWGGFLGSLRIFGSFWLQ